MGSAPFTRTTIVSQPLSSRIPHILAAAIGLALIFSPHLPLSLLNHVVIEPTQTSLLTGIMLCLIGWTIAVWARLQLSENWSAWVTLGNGHQLIQKGPYAIVRHPIYSGLLLALAGTAVVDGLLRSILGVLLIAIYWYYKSLSEDQLLHYAFGSAYDEYRSRTGALVPRLR
jgi:protein-S-isoprenylcysteine O-methyltransferase Ste14